jgi:hypothetical protein
MCGPMESGFGLPWIPGFPPALYTPHGDPHPLKRDPLQEPANLEIWAPEHF